MRKIKELINLTDRTALITGGAGYLGRAFGETLAELGANVAVADRNAAQAEQVAQTLTETYGIRAMAIVIDMAVEADVRTLPSQVAEKLGSLDILVNNAAFVSSDGSLSGWSVPFAEQSSATWREALEVNITAPTFLTQAAWPFLKASGKGSVINITSLYAFLGPDLRLYENTSMNNVAAYAASKGGLLQMTRWLSTVMAPEVRVNCVSPGGVWRSQPESFVKQFVSRTPLGRMAVEEDLKGVMAFLSSDMSQYVTGQHIPVDGGFSVW
jgi:Dehydrogenases with different specificities (related to short-chain alcohol dehydrogenases)